MKICILVVLTFYCFHPPWIWLKGPRVSSWQVDCQAQIANHPNNLTLSSLIIYLKQVRLLFYKPWGAEGFCPIKQGLYYMIYILFYFSWKFVNNTVDYFLIWLRISSNSVEMNRILRFTGKTFIIYLIWRIIVVSSWAGIV